MPDKQPMIQIGLLKRFLTHDGSCWVFFVLILIINGLAALSASLIPFIAGQLFVQILPGGNRQLLQVLPLELAMFLLTIVIASWSGYYVIHRLLDRLILDIRVEVFKKALVSPPACSELSVNTIFLYFFESIEKFRHNATRLATCLSRDFLVVVGLFTVMIGLNPDVSLLIFTMLVIMLFIRQIFYVDARQQNILLQRHHKISEMLLRILSHSRIVYLDRSCKQETEHFRNVFKRLQLASLKQLYQIKLLELLAAIFLIGIVTGFFYYFLQQLVLNQLTVEDAVVFFTAVLMLVFPLRQLFRVNFLLQQCSEALHVIFSLLDKDPAGMITESTDTAQTERAQGELKFEAVSYENRRKNLWLPSFDLEIASGKKIALINRNSHVNKLLADLVCRFEQPLTGRILLDGKDINRINHAGLCDNIAWISPDEDLLSDSVAENIAYGSSRCSKEIAITTAAHAGQAMEFIRKLPHGLQTEPEKCGVVFSDDQRQRILIARALLKNPGIIILDESVACFNTDNVFLMHALHALLSNRTTLILSSRPAMLDLADQTFDPENMNMPFTVSRIFVR